MVDQCLLAGTVAIVHPPYLGDGVVRLVDEDNEVVREEIQQGVGRLAGGAAVKDARVVLDAIAVAGLLEHLHVVAAPHGEPVGLELLPLALELRDLLFQLRFYLLKRPLNGPCGGDEVGSGINGNVLHLLQHLAGHGVQPLDPLYRISIEGNPDDHILVGRVDFQHIAAEPELAPGEIVVGAAVHDVHQLPHDRLQARLLPRV